MAPIIETNALTKLYKGTSTTVIAVDQASIAIQAGRICWPGWTKRLRQNYHAGHVSSAA